MAWKQVLTSAELAEGQKIVVEVEDTQVLLVRYQGQAYATAASCPHMGGNLGRGKLTEDGAVVCPLHHSAFDIKTGNVLTWSPWPPVIGKVMGSISREKVLIVYPTKEENGAISIDI